MTRMDRKMDQQREELNEKLVNNIENMKEKLEKNEERNVAAAERMDKRLSKLEKEMKKSETARRKTEALRSESEKTQPTKNNEPSDKPRTKRFNRNNIAQEDLISEANEVPILELSEGPTQGPQETYYQSTWAKELEHEMSSSAGIDTKLQEEKARRRRDQGHSKGEKWEVIKPKSCGDVGRGRVQSPGVQVGLSTCTSPPPPPYLNTGLEMNSQTLTPTAAHLMNMTGRT